MTLSKTVAEAICNALSIKSRPGVYFLGSNAERVSFSSQQERAFNLIWALTETGKLDREAHVAVVGAGVGGLTASAAAHVIGCDVTLIEQASKWCSIHEQTDKRFIHPTINSWPDADLGHTTDFPFLNWCAAPCREVRKQIVTEWDAYFGGHMRLKRGCRVTNIGRTGTKLYLTTTGLTSPDHHFDVVVLAVGFGHERKVNHTSNLSYWTDFQWHSGSDAPHFLVSGSGDGGVIEVLNLCFSNFDKGQLTIHSAIKLEKMGLRAHLLEIEKEAKLREETFGSDASSRFLAEAYNACDFSPALEAFLEDGVAIPGAGVTLIHTGPTPFERKAAPIHRILLSLAMQPGRVKTERGQLVDGERALLFRPHDAEPRLLKAEMIVARHGATGALEALLEAHEVDTLYSADQRKLVNSVGGLLVPTSFYGSAVNAHSFPSLDVGRPDYISQVTFKLPMLFSFVGFSPSYTFRKHGKSVKLCIFVSENSGFPVERLPNSVFGIPLDVSEPMDADLQSHESAGPHKMLRAELAPGDHVFVRSPSEERRGPSPTAVITCFIRRRARPDERYGLTAGHVVRHALGWPLLRAYGDSELELGRVFELVGPQEKDVAQYDCATILINPSVEVSNKARGVNICGVLSQEEIVGSRDELRVYKVTEHRRSEGVITGFAVRMAIRGAGVFEGLVEVRSTSKSAFSEKGESGAPVLTESGMLIGFVMAGNQEFSYVQPISPILKLLDATLIGIEDHVEQAASNKSEELADLYAMSVIQALGQRWITEENVEAFDLLKRVQEQEAEALLNLRSYLDRQSPLESQLAVKKFCKQILQSLSISQEERVRRWIEDALRQVTAAEHRAMVNVGGIILGLLFAASLSKFKPKDFELDAVSKDVRAVAAVAAKAQRPL